MNKLLGAALVLAAGVWARWMTVVQRRRRRDVLASLCAALRCMSEEIRMTRVPMPELLEALGARYPDGAGAFFRRIAAGIGRGQGLGEAWQQAAEELPLPREERMTLQELGWGLRGDEEAACRALAAASLRLERLLEEWDRQRPEEEKRETALWLSGSALLVILLI